jgi:hypothetical protein
MKPDEEDPIVVFKKLENWINTVKGQQNFDPYNFVDNVKTSAALNVAREILNPPKEEKTNAQKIVTALNSTYPDWATTKVSQNEIPLWETLGFAPDLADKWVQNNLDIHDAFRWGSHWEPEEVLNWKKTTFSPSECMLWKTHNISYKKASEWNHAPSSSIGQISSWVSQFPDVSSSDLKALFKTAISSNEVRAWREKGISYKEIVNFLKKNYSLDDAANFKKKYGDRYVPYINEEKLIKSSKWKKIIRNAKRHGWSVTEVENGWVENEKTITLKRNHSIVFIRFKRNKFLEGFIPGGKACFSVKSLCNNILST